MPRFTPLRRNTNGFEEEMSDDETPLIIDEDALVEPTPEADMETDTMSGHIRSIGGLHDQNQSDDSALDLSFKMKNPARDSTEPPSSRDYADPKGKKDMSSHSERSNAAGSTSWKSRPEHSENGEQESSRPVTPVTEKADETARTPYNDSGLGASVETTKTPSQLEDKSPSQLNNSEKFSVHGFEEGASTSTEESRARSLSGSSGHQSKKNILLNRLYHSQLSSTPKDNPEKENSLPPLPPLHRVSAQADNKNSEGARKFVEIVMEDHGRSYAPRKDPRFRVVSEAMKPAPKPLFHADLSPVTPGTSREPSSHLTEGLSLASWNNENTPSPRPGSVSSTGSSPRKSPRRRSPKKRTLTKSVAEARAKARFISPTKSSPSSKDPEDHLGPSSPHTGSVLRTLNFNEDSSGASPDKNLYQRFSDRMDWIKSKSGRGPRILCLDLSTKRKIVDSPPRESQPEMKQFRRASYEEEMRPGPVYPSTQLQQNVESQQNEPSSYHFAASRHSGTQQSVHVSHRLDSYHITPSLGHPISTCPGSSGAETSLSSMEHNYSSASAPKKLLHSVERMLNSDDIKDEADKKKRFPVPRAHSVFQPTSFLDLSSFPAPSAPRQDIPDPSHQLVKDYLAQRDSTAFSSLYGSGKLDNSADERDTRVTKRQRHPTIPDEIDPPRKKRQSSTGLSNGHSSSYPATSMSNSFGGQDGRPPSRHSVFPAPNPSPSPVHFSDRRTQMYRENVYLGQPQPLTVATSFPYVHPYIQPPVPGQSFLHSPGMPTMMSTSQVTYIHPYGATLPSTQLSSAQLSGGCGGAHWVTNSGLSSPAALITPIPAPVVASMLPSPAAIVSPVVPSQTPIPSPFSVPVAPSSVAPVAAQPLPSPVPSTSQEPAPVSGPSSKTSRTRKAPATNKPNAVNTANELKKQVVVGEPLFPREALKKIELVCEAERIRDEKIRLKPSPDIVNMLEDAPGQVELIISGKGLKNPFYLESRRPSQADAELVYDDEGKIMCPYNGCPGRVTSRRTLNRHLKNHDTNRRYLCNFCAKGFNDSYDLKRHIRTHTGVKPFACDECPKKFSQRCSLETHLKKVHGRQLNYGYKERRDKAYVCEECAFSTDRGSAYKRHLKNIHPEHEDLHKLSDRRHFKRDEEADGSDDSGDEGEDVDVTDV